jgi:hypothetical protein
MCVEVQFGNNTNSGHGKNKHNIGNVSIRRVRALESKYYTF